MAKKSIETKVILSKGLPAIGLLIPLVIANQAWASQCTQTTLNNYLTAGFTCTVGDQTLSNFSFSSATITANEVTVGPDSIAPADSYGLSFSSSELSVLGSGREDMTISWTISAPTAEIDDAYLAIAGIVTGDGSATVGETLTNGSTLGVSLPSPATDEVVFAPTSQLSTTKDALVIGVTGTTSISAIKDDFSEIPVAVPEPASMTLLGSGLIALGLVRRRRRKSL